MRSYCTSCRAEDYQWREATDAEIEAAGFTPMVAKRLDIKTEVCCACETLGSRRYIETEHMNGTHDDSADAEQIRGLMEAGES